MQIPAFLILILLGIADTTGLAQDESALRGKRIYEQGLGSGTPPVTAMVGQPPVAVPASAMPCAGCHGPDGRGRPEGGMTPADITWSSLTRPYEVRTPSGRERGPYDALAVKRAITQGIDPNGNQLDTVMPRYQLSHQDADDLIAWLQAIEHLDDPGLSDDTVTVGVPLAPGERWQHHNTQVRAILDAVAVDWNQRGGIYGRRLELAYHQSSGSPSQRFAALRQFVEERRPFVLLAAFLPGLEHEILQLATERALPIIGTFSLEPVRVSPPNKYVFHLGASLSDQARVLVRSAAEQTNKLATAVVHGGTYPTVASAIVDACASSGWPVAPNIIAVQADDSPELAAERLSREGIELLFYLGLTDPVAEARFWQQAKKSNWQPKVMAPGRIAGRELRTIAPHLAGLTLSYPTTPADRTFLAQRDYARLAAKHPLPQNPGDVETTVLAAIKLLETAMTQGGRNISRHTLIEQLEALHGFKTGWLPPLTYGPNRRTGAKGAHLYIYDKAKAAWTSSNEYRPVYP